MPQLATGTMTYRNQGPSKKEVRRDPESDRRRSGDFGLGKRHRLLLVRSSKQVQAVASKGIRERRLLDGNMHQHAGVRCMEIEIKHTAATQRRTCHHQETLKRAASLFQEMNGWLRVAGRKHQNCDITGTYIHVKARLAYLIG
jgi:hypothetical protein